MFVLLNKHVLIVRIKTHQVRAIDFLVSNLGKVFFRNRVARAHGTCWSNLVPSSLPTRLRHGGEDSVGKSNL